jgi:hypothetical protein
MTKIFPIEKLMEEADDLYDEEEILFEKKLSKKERERFFVKRNKKQFVEDWEENN